MKIVDAHGPFARISASRFKAGEARTIRWRPFVIS